VAEDFLKCGTKLDRYEIHELLGVGDMGHVYRAHDVLLKREVVIKMVGEMTEDRVKRFFRKAEAISKVSHPNIVEIFDCREDGSRPYIVMEFLQGENLSSRLERGAMPIGEAVDMILGICSGLFACHCREIIHRDIAPASIFLHQASENDTLVKVLAFDVTALSQRDGEEVTRFGQEVDTHRYASPEQIRHLDVDFQSDQYAIGLLLYAALIGRSPFARYDGSALERAIVKAFYPLPRIVRPEIPAGLEAVVLKAMNPEKRRRFLSVREMGQALLPFASPTGKCTWTPQFTEASRPILAKSSAMHDIAAFVDRGKPPADYRPGIVVPVAPLLDGSPLVDTEPQPEPQLSDTAVARSYSKPKNRVVPIKQSMDLHFRSDEKPRSNHGWPIQAAPFLRHYEAKHPTSAEIATSTIWHRKRPLLVATILLAALLCSLATWLITRVTSR
jgi:serine/threonine protein kinase